MAAPAIVKHGYGYVGMDNPVTASFDAAALPTVGNLVVVFAVGNNAFAGTTATIDDNQTGANTYTKQASAPQVVIWTCPLAAIDQATYVVTVTNGTTNAIMGVTLIEVSGFDAAIYDGTPVAVQEADPHTEITTNIPDTTYAEDLILGVCRIPPPNTFTSYGTGFAAVHEETAQVGSSVIWQATSVAGPYDPHWHFSASVWCVHAGIAIKGAAAAGGSILRQMLMHHEG